MYVNRRGTLSNVLSIRIFSKTRNFIVEWFRKTLGIYHFMPKIDDFQYMVQKMNISYFIRFKENTRVLYFLVLSDNDLFIWVCVSSCRKALRLVAL